MNKKPSLVDYEFYYWIYKYHLEDWERITDLAKAYEVEQLSKTPKENNNN